MRSLCFSFLLLSWCAIVFTFQVFAVWFAHHSFSLLIWSVLQTCNIEMTPVHNSTIDTWTCEMVSAWHQSIDVSVEFSFQNEMNEQKSYEYCMTCNQTQNITLHTKWHGWGGMELLFISLQRWNYTILKKMESAKRFTSSSSKTAEGLLILRHNI